MKAFSPEEKTQEEGFHGFFVFKKAISTILMFFIIVVGYALIFSKST